MVVYTVGLISPAFAGIVALFILYGLIAPLIVSAYVYDFSGYYEMNWLTNGQNKTDTRSILNIHSGFDETSFILQGKFPTSDIKALDFYNPEAHTEEAIKRARKVTDNFANTYSMDSSKIPEKSQSVDLICLLSAAHEIRDKEERVLFLKECRRVCKPDGRIVVLSLIHI